MPRSPPLNSASGNHQSILCNQCFVCLFDYSTSKLCLSLDTHAGNCWQLGQCSWLVWNASPDAMLGTAGGRCSSPCVRNRSPVSILSALLAQSFLPVQSPWQCMMAMDQSGTGFNLRTGVQDQSGPDLKTKPGLGLDWIQFELNWVPWGASGK